MANITQEGDCFEGLENFVEVALDIVAVCCMQASGICIARYHRSGYEMESHFTETDSLEFPLTY